MRDEPPNRPDPTHASSALGDLLARTLPHLRVFVRRKLGERLSARDSVSDVVQSACREVLQDLDGGAPDAEEVRKRLFRQAERKIVDRGRYWNATKRNPTDTPEPPEAEVPTPLSHAERRDELERVLNALETLATDDRTAILLGVVLELPHAEIARQLGRSEGAARTLLCRALARLSTRLA